MLQFIFLLLCTVFLLGTAEAKAESLKGKVYPAEWKEFIAPETGLKVLQLTTNAADDSGLYYTTERFIPRDNGLVFASQRTGRWNLFYMNLTNGTILQLTDGARVKATGAAVCPETLDVFYMDGQNLKAVNIKSLEERTLYTIPDGYGVGASLSVSDDGQVVGMSIVEKIATTTKTEIHFSDAAERFAKKPWSTVIAVHTDGSGWSEVHREQAWLSHVLVNPKQPDIILYATAGPMNLIKQKMHLIQRDGTQNRPLRVQDDNVKINHQFWFQDGIHVGYNAVYKDEVNKTRQEHIGVANILTGECQEYGFTADTHTQVNHDGTLFVGDGTRKSPYLTVYKLEEGRLIPKQIFRHDSNFDKEHLHPHPSFTPDNRAIFFTSSGGGNGDIYLIQLPGEY